MYTILLKNGTKLNENQISIKEVLKRKDISMFFLTINEKTIAVDLKTGLFYLGISIGNIALNPDYAMEDHDFRLVYYKRKRMELSFGEKSTKPYVYAYLLGWQFTENDQNYQRFMFWNQETNTIEIKRKR